MENKNKFFQIAGVIIFIIVLINIFSSDEIIDIKDKSYINILSSYENAYLEEEIKIKNFALLNSKTKRIEINTLDGKSHKLYANIEEKDFPYQKENFTKWIEKYSNK